MKASITINMDNYAFDNPGPELARILRDAAETVENFDGSTEATFYRNMSLMDSNGNRVGQLKITGKPNNG